jgi:hypothetical protein
MATGEFTLNVWRLHPHGCAILPAERTLGGSANRGGVRWCGPFTNANKAGWWIFPPADIDVIWKGGKHFEWELLTPYNDDDYQLIRFLVDDAEADQVAAWLPEGGRTKFTWGLVDRGVVQIWTGCIFETPPGWGLHIRSPINFPPRACHVMEAVLETDWLQYDIWLNVMFDQAGELVQLRRDGWPPIAQIVPVRRDSYDPGWRMNEQLVHRNSPEATRVFEYFVEYNRKKFASGGRHAASRTDPTVLKDSAAYHKERKRLLDNLTMGEHHRSGSEP